MAKILVVEDNALNIKLFCDLLAAHGHEPQAVTDSREALEAARAFQPDLVITDIHLICQRFLLLKSLSCHSRTQFLILDK